MFFSNSENEVWMELKDYGWCWNNLKDYYSRKCTLNQSNEKVLEFFEQQMAWKMLKFQSLHLIFLHKEMV